MQPEMLNHEDSTLEPSPKAMKKDKGPGRLGTILLWLLLVAALVGAAWFAYRSSQLNSQLASTRQELVSLQEDHDALMSDYDTLSADYDKAKTELEETKGILSTTQSDLETAASDNEALQAKIGKMGKYVDLLFESAFTFNLDNMESQVKAFSEDPNLTELYNRLDSLIIEGTDEEFFEAWDNFTEYIFVQIEGLLK